MPFHREVIWEWVVSTMQMGRLKLISDVRYEQLDLLNKRVRIQFEVSLFIYTTILFADTIPATADHVVTPSVLKELAFHMT